VTVGARATRRLLDDGPERTEVLAALRQVPVTDLKVAGPDVRAAMGTLQETVKSHLSAPGTKFPNSWVTAAKCLVPGLAQLTTMTTLAATEVDAPELLTA
jgi:hypothetical protein